MNVPIRDLPEIMFFPVSRPFSKKEIFLAVLPPKEYFEFLLGDCPLKTKFKNLLAAHPPKEQFGFFAGRLPVKSKIRNFADTFILLVFFLKYR